MTEYNFASRRSDTPKNSTHDDTDSSMITYNPSGGNVWDITGNLLQNMYFGQTVQ